MKHKPWINRLSNVSLELRCEPFIEIYFSLIRAHGPTKTGLLKPFWKLNFPNLGYNQANAVI